ncbi:MAG: DUF4386 family protein [Thermoplasmata archaeon]|nr:MAG: DUF4386 family protein [Thermoplasmata archaeon]
MNELNFETGESTWKGLYRIGGAAALLQLASVLTILVVTTTLGLKPVTVEEYFSVMQNNRLAGILRDDFTSLFLVALYLGTFPALYFALRRVNVTYTILATLCTFVAVATCFATHSGFSMLHLSDQYAAAITDAERSQLLAAGRAVIASDMWNSSGAYMSGILLQGAGILISVIMLRSKDFNKITAYAGILGNGFDLAQHILHPFAPSVSAVLMIFMGTFYLVWFPMLARDLLRLGCGVAQKNG